MCLMYNFFHMLLFYFTLLILLTFTSKRISYQNIFVMITLFLMVWLFYLIIMYIYMYWFHLPVYFKRTLTSFKWLSYNIMMAWSLDLLAMRCAIFIIIIGLAINWYAAKFLEYKGYEATVILLINWFIFNMVLLVLSYNWGTVFFCWMLISVNYVALVVFWAQGNVTVKSSFKNFLLDSLFDVYKYISSLKYDPWAGVFSLSNLFFLMFMFYFIWSCYFTPQVMY